MVIQTEITYQDVRAFSRQVTMGTDGGVAMYGRLFRSAVAMGILVALTLVLTGAPLNMPCVMAGLFGGAFWLVVFSRLQARNMGPAPDGCVLGLKKISVAEEGISCHSTMHETLVRWPAVRAVLVAREHFFVMIDRNAGIIIPRQAFASTAEQDQFLVEVSQYSVGTTSKL